MYMVLYDSEEGEEFVYLYDAEEFAASLPGSEVWELEEEEELTQHHWQFSQ